MARKTFRLGLDDRQRALWGAVLPAYGATAFPPGGSECAQAARAALEDLARRFAAAGDHVDIGARQRPVLKAAVKWYFTEIVAGAEEDRDRLLAALHRP